jgi:hypothetical protein
MVQKQFNLLAIWACHNKKNSYDAGLGPLRRGISEYREFIEEHPTVVAGDFNDNGRRSIGAIEQPTVPGTISITASFPMTGYRQFQL